MARIISKKAAETFTPVTLELGVRNFASVTKNADIHLVAKRLLWGKPINAGQVCVSPNYTLIDENVVPGFMSELKSAMYQFYPRGAKVSPDYGRIVSARQLQPLKKMLGDTRGKILLGGDMDEAELYIEPTVVQILTADDSLIVDELFGPLFPILPFIDLDTVIRMANELSGKPLGLYLFGTKSETKRILNETRSGGAIINDAFFHASIPTL